MNANRIKAWQSSAVAVSLIMAAWQVYRTPEPWDDTIAADIIGDQKTFEVLLLRRVGRIPAFRNIVAHPHDLGRGGDSVPAIIITGQYYEGSSSSGHRLCFVAPRPYRPAHKLNLLTKSGSESLDETFAGLNSPSVLDYMDLLRASDGLEYSYAWWESSSFSRAVWYVVYGLLSIALWPEAARLVQRYRKSSKGERSKRRVPRFSAKGYRNATSQPARSAAVSSTTPGIPAGRSAEDDQNVVSAQDIGRDVAFSAKPDDFYPTETRRR